MATKPVQNGIITDTYEQHQQRSPKGSWGIDISSTEKEPVVVAAYDCIVQIVGLSSTYGNRVWVKNLDGLYVNLFTIYPHLRFLPTFKVGDRINEGQQIGIMGNTGLIGVNGKIVNNNDGHILLPLGMHLHFGIQKSTSDGSPYNCVEPLEIIELYK